MNTHNTEGAASAIMLLCSKSELSDIIAEQLASALKMYAQQMAGEQQPENEWLTTQQAMRALGYANRKTFRRAVARLKIPASRLSPRKTLYHRDDINAAMQHAKLNPQNI